MLKSIRLRDFRSFADTKDIELRSLNLFIGPNSAGKSAFLGAVELFLRSLEGFSRVPLALSELSTFASFDSVLRRHWTPRQHRPSEFILNYSWEPPRPGKPLDFEFACKGRAEDNTSYVAKETVATRGGDKLVLEASDSSGRTSYRGTFRGKEIRAREVHFRGPVPIVLGGKGPLLREDIWRLSAAPLEVVRPYRPVPRSFYVLDDPSLSSEDRSLITFLIELWRSKEPYYVKLQQRLVTTLKTLGLIEYFAIKQLKSAAGPKVVRIEVAPTLRRQSVTIADVGFGLSQALPLAASEARLSHGYLIAYQPEVHLHPYAQSRLADVFCSSVTRGNQLFVETHSPDLVLRLQERVAAGVVKPGAVRIFCLSNPKGTTEVKIVDLDDKGSPAVPWPPGFLDTSLNLARELAYQRV